MNNKYTVPWASDPKLQAIPELAHYLNTGNRKNQLGNISPRVSFSWDPFKDNKTFVRGGFGIFRIAPPITIEPAEIDLGLEIFDRALGRALG